MPAFLLHAPIGVLACLPVLVAASDFLSPVSVQDVESTLLAELAGNFRPGADKESSKDRLDSLEAALRSLYDTVPHEADGTLNHAVVRYLLHRFFAQRHGWYVRGLEPAGDAKNASASELQSMKEWVPNYLQSFLEQLIGGRGLKLRELAVFTATLEDLIHHEAAGRLREAYKHLQLDASSPIDHENATKVIETYFMIYMMGGEFKSNGRSDTEHKLQVFSEKVRGWGETKEWLRKMREELEPATTLEFSKTAHVVQEVGERYMVFNDRECAALKSELLSGESKKAGRVRLTEFYKKGLAGMWEFNEKIDYLRTLGAIDETDPSNPYVIIPNYVGSRPNCLMASNIYVVCCRNECEDLMASLERDLQSPFASPERIGALVAALRSDTVKAPRQISETLMQRLRDIASSHGGEVPVHGRLFAQWMHHAYPRECPFPHETGTTNPQTPDEWMEMMGVSESKLSVEDLQKHIDADVFDPSKEHEALPWSEREELLAPSAAKHRDPLRNLGVFAGLATVASGLLFMWKAVLATGVAGKTKGRDCFGNKDFCHQA